MRGDIAVGISPGDYGKPCPVLVLQSNAFLETESVIVALSPPTSAPIPCSFAKPSSPPRETACVMRQTSCSTKSSPFHEPS